MEKNNTDQTSIPCKVRTRDRLMNLGTFGESWDDLLNRLADIIEGNKE